MEPWLMIVIIVGVALLAIFLSIKSLVVICQPSEVVIFSGPPKREGANVGYRAIRGGRGLRLPLLETVDRLDLTNMSVEVAVRGAYTRDGVPLNVQGVANVKIDGNAPGLDNAVERLLGMPRESIIQLASETLEGNLRGVLARLSPEQVNEDKESFARELIEEAEEDLGRLGLVLDTLKIQTVADEVGYLDSIGRKQNALLLRRSRIAEAERKSEADIKNAENLQKTRIAQISAQMEVAKAEADNRIVMAQTARPAEVAQIRSTIEAQIARAQAELNVQKARIEQVRVQLEADVVAPALAYKEKAEADARAAVAHIRASGHATADGLRQLAQRWHEAGDSAREIFLLEKLQLLVSIMVDTVSHAKVDQLTMVGSGGPLSVAGQSASLMEQLKATGIDVPTLLERLTGTAEGLRAISSAPFPQTNTSIPPSRTR